MIMSTKQRKGLEQSKADRSHGIGKDIDKLFFPSGQSQAEGVAAVKRQKIDQRFYIRQVVVRRWVSYTFNTIFPLHRYPDPIW